MTGRKGENVRKITALALAGAFALGACGGDGEDDVVATTTTTQPETTTTLSPEDAFIADVQRQLTSDGPPGFGERALELLSATCDNLTEIPEGIRQDDAPSDSPQSDAALGDLTQTMSLAIVMDETGYPPEVGAVLLRTMTEHLCPEHTEVVEEFLETRGQ